MDINEKIEQLEKEIAELKKVVKEQEEPIIERKTKRTYYYISALTGVVSDIDSGEDGRIDIHRYRIGNYFHTRERAEEVAEKIRMLLKLERLHDVLCPDHVPDWGHSYKEKYYVYYNYNHEVYMCDYARVYKHNDVYFPTEEVAQKVCDMLNAEMDDKKC